MGIGFAAGVDTLVRLGRWGSSGSSDVVDNALRFQPFDIVARFGDLPFAPVGFFDTVLAALLGCSALLALLLRSRLASVAALGVTGLAMALIFVLYSAPDLAMTQVMVETLSVIVLVLVFARLPRMVRRSGAVMLPMVVRRK